MRERPAIAASEIVADRIRLALVQLLVAHQGLVVIAVAAPLQGVLRWSCSLRVGLLEQTLFFGGAALPWSSSADRVWLAVSQESGGVVRLIELNQINSSRALR